jgi:hypothetical protein
MPEEINPTNEPVIANGGGDTVPAGTVTSPNGDSDVLAKLPEPDWDKDKANISDFFGKTATIPDGKKDEEIKVVAKPEDENKPTDEENKEVVQDEEKKPETVTEPVNKPTGDSNKAQVPTNIPVSADDSRMSKLTEGERTILKRASKEAREFTLARLEDLEREKAEKAELLKTVNTLKEGRTPVPESYYENPNAYVLLPEYHQVTQQVGIANAVVEHWTNALAKVKAGEEYQDLGVDANGNIIRLNDAIPASPRAEAEITGYLNHAINQSQRVQQQQQQLQQGFHAKVQQVFNNIAEVQEKFYPKDVWENKESQQYKITEQVREGLRGLGITPANPLYELFSRTTAALLMRNAANTVVAKETEKKARIEEVAKKAGPNGNATVNGGSATGVTTDGKKEVSFSDFKNAIRKSSVSFR